MSFLGEFVGHLIRRNMEDPEERRKKRNAHLQDMDTRAQALKEQWGQTVKTPRFWQSDAAAATVTWQLNPLMKRLPGRREAYPEQH